MNDNILNVKLRDVKEAKAKVLRQQGLLPAVVYGADQENIHVTVEKNNFIRLYREAGANTIVRLNVEGKGEENVLIHEVDYNPVTDEVSAIDFIRIKMDEKITAKIPLEFIGQSKAVKDLAGIFIANIDELEVTCLPADLPKVFEVDITSLETFDDAIYVKDLVVKAGVEIEREADDVIATVVPPRSEEELAELDKEVEEDIDKVEVEEKGKIEEEGEAGEVAAGKKEGEQK
ncbi:MAG: 50S ribosomal protein L25 [Patescibacteria group bacterium]